MSTNQNAVIWAIESNDIVLLQKLLNSGESANAVSEYGVHALVLSAMTGRPEMARLLVSHGADVKAVDGKTLCSALHMAAQANETYLCELLVDSGADVNAKASDDATPLHAAAGSGSREVCALLLSRGAKIDALCAARNTPLFKAARSNRLECAQLLIEHGADVNHANVNGITVLKQTSLNGHDAMCCLLKLHGADCGEETFYKRMSMKQAAARGGFSDLLIKLIDQEPDPGPGDDLESLKTLANRFGKEDMVAMVEATMARRAIQRISSIRRSAGSHP